MQPAFYRTSVLGVFNASFWLEHNWQPDDNPLIGIILCTDKTNVEAEYTLGRLSNNIFASRYVLYIPDKEQLIQQVEPVLKEWHEGESEDKNPQAH